MVKISAEIKGIDALMRKANMMAVSASSGLERALNRSAQQVVNDAKRKAPVDSGLLRASLHITPAQKIGDDIVAKAGTNLEYAPYVEFGTGFRGSVSNENPRVKSFAPNWSGQFAQPFLWPALYQNQEKIQQNITKEVIRLSRGGK